MNRILIITGVLLLFFKQSRSQQDSILKLQEVVVSDFKLKKFSVGFKLYKITDTLIQRNVSSLTGLLEFNSHIYFKENGYGMVSSPSFRGTNASQTAVIWNGIAINSALTGQTDFNTVTVNSFNSVVIRSGGGSVQYGSGAIGGSIHLENTIFFKNKKDYRIRLLYGDYSTFAGHSKSIFSSQNSYADVGIDYITSENNYKYSGTNKKNENGEFNTLNLSTNAGLKLGTNNILKFHSNLFTGDRNFSGTLTAPSNDNYEDLTSRNLLVWKNYKSATTYTFKFAHLFEEYKYYPNKNRSEFSHGQTNSFITDFACEYSFNPALKSSVIVNYTTITAEGSNIGKNNRNTLATTLLLNHELSARFSYGVNVRKEFLNDFDNPVLFSVDGKYKVNNWYTLSFNASKNFRVPTFNDLFWEEGGNSNLQPETSLQGEIGNIFNVKDFKFSLSAYLIKSQDMIKWVPDNSGVWSPVNVDKVKNTGLEVSSAYKKTFEQYAFELNVNYAYTNAINQANNNQLIYVPYHKLTGLINYSCKKIGVWYQFLWNGEVYSTTDNKETVDGYNISNLGLEYNIHNKQKPYLVGFKLNNLFNKYYENVAFRPMPNRHIQFYLNLNF
ncbi:TonB-dependent receptor plug domain-containing protein [Abyssalbus ytuae]|uniref:TonB-dependent receptor n=1 Tax=Abyssalbus ytuae TaxID=2926907 RepID=A0A9E6ZY97_9FLAO|nr:TonB-dependent receptor [Abyssalbus ytuae]UOB19171.1 TonB-dependent receptor [Abyssalbus ytuae]